MLAEVSHPSVGVGIELGWADASNVPIILLRQKGARISSALTAVSTKGIAYSDSQDLIAQLTDHLAQIKEEMGPARVELATSAKSGRRHSH